MIKCRLSHLEARARERGYSMDRVLGCVVVMDGDNITVDETHRDYPRKRSGLGDRVAAVLAAVGVTPKRVEAVTGRPCGCKERAEAITRLGRRLGIG